MGRSAGGRGNATSLDNTELAAVDNISVFILPSIVNNVGHIGSRDRLGLHRRQKKQYVPSDSSRHLQEVPLTQFRLHVTRRPIHSPR